MVGMRGAKTCDAASIHPWALSPSPWEKTTRESAAPDLGSSTSVEPSGPSARRRWVAGPREEDIPRREVEEEEEEEGGDAATDAAAAAAARTKVAVAAAAARMGDAKAELLLLMLLRGARRVARGWCWEAIEGALRRAAPVCAPAAAPAMRRIGGERERECVRVVLRAEEEAARSK